MKANNNIAKKIGLNKANEKNLFYFVANVVVWRKSDGRCLILNCHRSERVHPLKYSVIGGKLEWTDLDFKNPTRINGDVLDFEDSVEELLKREAQEEAGIRIGSKVMYLNSVAFVRPDGIPVVLVKFAAEHKGGKIQLEVGSFEDFAWVNAKEVKRFDCIEGIEQEIKRTIVYFSA